MQSVAQTSLNNVAGFLAPGPGNLARGYQSTGETRDSARLPARPQTLQGLSLKDDAKNKGISILDKMLAGISDEELRTFLNTLNKLCSNMTVTEVEE